MQVRMAWLRRGAFFALPERKETNGTAGRFVATRSGAAWLR
jgi:hypothetical protein